MVRQEAVDAPGLCDCKAQCQQRGALGMGWTFPKPRFTSISSGVEKSPLTDMQTRGAVGGQKGKTKFWGLPGYEGSCRY